MAKIYVQCVYAEELGPGLVDRLGREKRRLIIGGKLARKDVFRL